MSSQSKLKLGKYRIDSDMLVLPEIHGVLRVVKHHVSTSSPGLFPQKMGGAGKGPGIGWSRVQPKYS